MGVWGDDDVWGGCVGIWMGGVMWNVCECDD